MVESVKEKRVVKSEHIPYDGGDSYSRTVGEYWLHADQAREQGCARVHCET